MSLENSYVHTEYDRESVSNGHVSQTTPSDTQTLCEVNTYQYVVPIIFIPGIMGSNLVNGKKEVWFPPNMKLKEGLHLFDTLLSSWLRGAASRQKQLDPTQTSVSFDGPIYLKKSEIKLTKKQAHQRGWGTVWWTGYGDILIYLEKYLNNQLADLSKEGAFKGSDEWAKIVKHVQEITSDLARENSISKENVEEDSTTEAKGQLSNEYLSKWKLKNEGQTPEEVSLINFHKMGLVEFPVYACGYNWLQSNDQSARDVVERMEEIKQEYSGSENPKFLKFIIISHSMGGLVTRSIVEQGLMAEDIAGVSHGVMPSSGAPAVYQRIVNGWDGKDATGKQKDSLTSVIFGHTSKRMTPVLANSPGGLQLLPFANFNDNGDYDWLKIHIGERIVKVPINGDPYTNIYTKQKVWWEMVNPALVDPAGLLEKRLKENDMAEVIDFYHQNIQIVSDFQNLIQDTFHENTYAHYGADENFKSTGDIIWKADDASISDLMNMTDEQILNLGYTGTEKEQYPYTSEDNIRKIPYQYQDQTHYATFTLQVKLKTPGDGTVCFQSGQDVRGETRKLLNTFVINGYEHSASYSNKDVQLNTLYCVSKLIDEMVDDSEVGTCEESTANTEV